MRGTSGLKGPSVSFRSTAETPEARRIVLRVLETIAPLLGAQRCLFRVGLGLTAGHWSSRMPGGLLRLCGETEQPSRLGLLSSSRLPAKLRKRLHMPIADGLSTESKITGYIGLRA